MQDVNTGKCTEAHLRYFYDHRVSTCRLFYYSGCGGNENNFATEEECRQQCKSGKYDSWDMNGINFIGTEERIK